MFSFTVKTIHPKWGFYGHRLINKLAVFSLPQDVLKFYKSNIDYITEHSIDPDKRRYATRHEAVRHYIDIDAWGVYPFEAVPRDFNNALLKYSHYELVTPTDTTHLIGQIENDTFSFLKLDSTIFTQLDLATAKEFFKEYVRPQYYEDQWTINTTTVDTIFGLKGSMDIKDEFSKEGILPYHLLSMKYWLTQAFAERDFDKILRLSAEFGHYIGDAHVPLHTTKNYNGQLTDQVGIHAFWESRIPELFAEKEYNFIVGMAEYIENPKKYFWDMVLESHLHLEDVLKIEKELSQIFPDDKQFCFDERLGKTLRIQCPEYAKEFQNRMNGMVESRMQDAILAISSIWYTCWVDGGQPDLSSETFKIEPEEIKINSEIKTRSHE